MARRRARWKKYQGRLAPGRLVFIDETWVKTNMTRRHGRAQRGQRLVAKAPYGRWRTLTFLAALRVDRIDAPLVLDGPINGRAFTAYVEQFLVPTLAPGDIVIMDNLGSHKGKAVRRAIRAAGAKLLFLPPYIRVCSPCGTREQANVLRALTRGHKTILTLRYAQPSDRTPCPHERRSIP